MLSSIKHKGFAVILSFPSAAGKSSLAKALLKIDFNLTLSISATTRKARPNEVDGINYYFNSPNEFDKLIRQDALLEYAHIYGNYYGTPKDPIIKLLKQNKDVLFDIDYQGMVAIKQVLENVVTIFILPPNLNTLKQRIQDRGQDSREVVESRLKLATTEIEYAKDYDYIVVNDNFEVALKTIHSIIIAQRTNRVRLDLEHFLSRLKTPLN
ncbi:guanylate kinase [Candidatus Tisiphia endosymbiont of Beris chalybata]|uniref:guanylate kinase n=1 Tax=Candidatus Tisiphia endosymbiont of Beris chalybata TaxID=3066262 RepID=UPI00312C7462